MSLVLVMIACTGPLGWAGAAEDPRDQCILEWYVTEVYERSPRVRQVFPGLSPEERRAMRAHAKQIMAETQMDGLRRLYEQHVRQGVRADACPTRQQGDHQ